MIQFRTVCLSAHLDSFCRKLNELCGLEFVYADADPGETRRRIGWRMTADYACGPITGENTERAKDCELVYGMLRELDLFEARVKKGLKTVYASERWFKPIAIFGGGRWRVTLPGFLKLLVPHYRKMARRFVNLTQNPNFYVLAIGVHAVRDFVRMHRILHGDWRALFRAPNIKIERKLGGTVEGFPHMKLWGYFVEESKSRLPKDTARPEDGGSGNRMVDTSRALQILWVGGMSDLKRVDTLVKAFKRISRKRSAALLLIGEGPMRRYLEKLAGADRVAAGVPEWQVGKIVFHDYVKNDVVRALMRRADVYVMPSSAEEGWGAVVSEALAEGCPVLATIETGSAATILSDDCLFSAGDVTRLSDLLMRPIKMVKYAAEDWSGETAAARLMEIVGKGREG